MGNYSGTAVPQVSGPTYPGGYTQPANWSNPAVSGRDLIVHTGALRSAASELHSMADYLQGKLSSWQGAASAAAAPGVVGNWQAAQSLGHVIAKAYVGVNQFTSDLHQAHSDMAARLAMSADKYDAAEQHITTLISASADPTATIVESGGNNTAVDPGYGQNWTPQQQMAYARTQRLMHMPGNGGPNWQATFPITEDSVFSPGSTAGYTWDQVQQLLQNTDPGAISNAGTAYKALMSALTEVTGRLAAQGQQLAENWGGSTAVTAVSQVQQLHQTATDLQANTWAAYQALNWYGPVLATFKSSLPQPASAHPAAVKAANQAAQQRMAALNGHIQTAYYQMPGAVNKNLPPALAGNGGSGTTGGVAGGGATGGSAGGVSGGGASGGGVSGGGVSGGSSGIPGGAGVGAPGHVGGAVPGVSPAGGGAPGGTTPGGTIGQVPAPTQLAGVQPGGVGVINPGAPAPGAPGGPGGLGSVPPVGSGGGGGGVGVLPPLPSTGGGGTTGRVGVSGEVPAPGGEPAPGELGSVPGIGSAPAGDLAALGDAPTISPAGMITGQGVPAAADGASAEGLAASGGATADVAGVGGFPVMGGMSGGAATDGIGRARESWVAEEDGTWNAGPGPGGADPAAEGGVGGMMPAGTGSGTGRQRERVRQAWIADDDLWGTEEPAVPSVISRD